MSHDGRHANAPAQARARRTRTIASVAVLGLLALAAGVFLGSRGGEHDAAAPSTSPGASMTSSPIVEPSPTVEPSPSTEPTPAESVGRSPLDEGEHFVLAKEIDTIEDHDALVLDLGYFLTGHDANDAAAEAGVETPVPNDYYIVNDNPKLRTVPIAGDAEVRYIPTNSCCDLQEGHLSAWIDSINGAATNDYPDMSSTWWWVTVEGGEIVTIEQQYVP
jgi:hypothetical protein